MILRRLSQHVRAQDWFAVGLEFVLVVSGVFIGIQVSNWNEALADQREQARLLIELAADVSADIEEIEGVRETAGQRIKAIEALLDAAGVPIRPAFVDSDFRYIEDAEALERFRRLPAYRPTGSYEHVVAINQMRTLDGNRHTYTTLVNTNGFGLIRDRELARAIQRYYARVDEVRDLETFVAAQGDHARQQLQTQGISRISRVTQDGLQAAVRDAPYLAAALGDFQYSSFNQWEAMFGLREEAEALLHRLRPAG